MSDLCERAVAIVGLGGILPDAPCARAFRENVWAKKYSITEVPPERWSIEDYYDPDPAVPAKTYSKIGAWVRGFSFDWKRWHVPPRVSAAMDEGQQWAIAITAEALADYGYPQRKLDTERTAVVLGNAMAGERHYLTTLRISFPEYEKLLLEAKEFRDLPAAVRTAILARWREVAAKRLPEITEDTMPGELSNILSGRVANVLNLRGPNFTADAACASTFAALDSAVDMLVAGHCDAVVTGGVDRNMGTNSFVKFSKIGALSATGTRPFGDGADGFVMGEGSAAFLLKRLADAERDGDRVYAVVRGLGGSSDGKGKGITAPNPIGQQLAIARAWENAGLDPATAGLIEAHGTSTKVGDVVEVESLATVFKEAAKGSIALGSAKSNVGHLKAGAGAAGLLKAVWAVHEKMLPPTLHADPPNPGIDFAGTPFVLNHELREWKPGNGEPRRCGVSAYGFGGTNFHVVLEEHVPGALTKGQRPAQVAVPARVTGVAAVSAGSPGKAPLRGLLVLGAPSVDGLRKRVEEMLRQAKEGHVPPLAVPDGSSLAAAERLTVDYGNGEELVERLQKAQKALAKDAPSTWKAFQAQGVFRGSGPAAGKIAFLFTGQGSQYVNMGRDLTAVSPVVASVFEEADRVLEPIMGRRLTSYVFVDRQDGEAVKQAEEDLKQTPITQPALLTIETAIVRLLGEYGFEPDMVMGHSVGEYGALVAAGVLTVAEGLEAAAARGREMSRVSFGDNGGMAAVMAPADVVVQELRGVEGYVVPANLNARGQVVIGGETAALERAIEVLNKKGYQAQRLPVSHAFHTKIVAAAAGPLRSALDRFDVRGPRLPLVANVTADFYPSDPEAIKDVLCQQIASPVRWVEGVERLYAAGARAFVEVGPKRALKGFVDDVLADRQDVLSLFTNRPRPKEVASFNQALAGLYAAGYGAREKGSVRAATAPLVPRGSVAVPSTPVPAAPPVATHPAPAGDALAELRALLRKTLDSIPATTAVRAEGPYDRNDAPQGSVVISGTGLGLPGAGKPVMDPKNAARILAGEQFLGPVPPQQREGMAHRRITQLVKTADGSGHFQTIDDPKDVIKLAGLPGSFDLTAEYGVSDKLVEALDSTTQLAMAAGLDALREAGIPLVQTWKKTTTGKYLPERWMLPEALRDETGVVFASAFPGYDRFADEARRYYTFESRRATKRQLEELLETSRDAATRSEISRRIAELDALLQREPYQFDRRFLLRILVMGHSQFAEYIGARGPNAHVNTACASTASGVALAEDWIRCGRARRVVVVAADNVTSPNLIEWFGAGFIASGAAATDERAEDAALPFDRRRHGTLIGMGACALLVESQDAVEERGMRGIVELLSAETRNSAFHATRLDVDHVASVVESLVASAERRFGVDRAAIAPRTVFVSHETYTPARGGSAAAEITALRQVFGASANRIIVANTKGFTGHPMGVGIEDVIGVKILEHGVVPPVPNLKEPDPDLGSLTLSKGGRYDVEYAIHLAAGFGSQIALTFTRRIPGSPDRLDDRPRYERWLAETSGHDGAKAHVVKRVLRVAARTAPARKPAASTWRFGLGPTRRVVRPGEAPQPRHPEEPAEVPAVAGPTPVAQEDAALTGPERYDGVDLSFTRQTSGPQAGQVDAVVAKVLAIVAEKTGYPPDMLDMDLDLEADLGVDTVKQAETFAAVREAYGIARQDSLKLRDFPTLKHVVKFVYDSRPDLRAAPATTAPPDGSLTAQGRDDGVGPSVLRQADTLPAYRADPVVDRILSIVAEKTGYPEDMLEMDLDLEADLGVDTVKQAETFAAVREAYGIARQENLKLRDFPTLKHVVKFVYDYRPDLKPTEVPGGAGPTPAAQKDAALTAPERYDGVDRSSKGQTAAPRADRVAAVVARLEDADKMPRRVPVPSLRPPLAWCKPTGVSLGKGSRVVVVADEGGVAVALARALEKRGVALLSLDGATPTEEVTSRLAGWLKDGPVQGVFWLPALDVEPAIADMDLAAFREANRRRVKNLHAAMRTLYEAVAAPGTFLVSATRMGGLHGQTPEGAVAPLGGAVAGFTKAYKRERPEALVKVVDFAPGSPATGIADELVGEALFDPGVVEVGLHDDLRWTISLEERKAADGRPGLRLTRESVFVVTGAAGGITSAIVADLADASEGTFYLLDLVAEPSRTDPKIALFRRDREKLKLALIEEARARGERPTPVAIDRQILGVERSEAALRAIESVEAAGGRAHWRSANLLDGPAIGAIVEEIRTCHGRIDVLVHAGGVEISRKLGEKEAREFDLVFDIKADGFFSLLKAAEGMPLGATVVFSSVAGRFGNAGQTDYSAANNLLCTLSSALRRTRPETRAIAIDWTAWGGIGMATRGSIPQIMAAAGISMLPPESGIPTVRRELVAGGGSGEVVVAGTLGIMGAEYDPAGGLDVGKVKADLAARERPLLLVGDVEAVRLYGGLAVRTTLDPREQPFLIDHQIDGVPVLPGVMGTEAFAEVASVLCPGFHVAAIEDESFLLPFKFHRHQPATLHLSAVGTPGGAGEVVVHVELRSVLQPKPNLPAQERVHFRARVRMRREKPEAPKITFKEPAAKALPIRPEAVYSVYFHGPAYRVIDRASVEGDGVVALMSAGLPPNAKPERAEQVMGPRLLELCFQAAGLWLLARKETMGLPTALERATAYLPEEARGERRLFAIVGARRDGEAFDARVVDENGVVHAEVVGYRTVALPGRVTLPDQRGSGLES
ncbi:MAG TPA: SDR family NAD(P)-dependent oxidoreductase [Vicinamibacteria bacterium]|nr:SDR family NAD(P)-dependent oxidoreductase [Vicinamibacteria bacterium]